MLIQKKCSLGVFWEFIAALPTENGKKKTTTPQLCSEKGVNGWMVRIMKLAGITKLGPCTIQTLLGGRGKLGYWPQGDTVGLLLKARGGEEVPPSTRPSMGPPLGGGGQGHHPPPNRSV